MLYQNDYIYRFHSLDLAYYYDNGNLYSMHFFPSLLPTFLYVPSLVVWLNFKSDEKGRLKYRYIPAELEE